MPFLTYVPVSRPVALTLNAIAVGLALLLSIRWASAHNRLRAVLTLVAGLAIITLGFAFFLPASSIPAGWVTILQEGNDADLPAMIQGTATHVGSLNFFMVLSLFTQSGHLPVLGAVRMNLWLTCVNTLVFFAIAAFVTRRPWIAGLLTIGWRMAPMTVDIAVSAQPSCLLTFYELLGIIGWIFAVDQSPRGNRTRAGGFVLMAVLTVLMRLTRTETALIGVASIFWAWLLVEGRLLAFLGRRAKALWQWSPGAAGVLGVAVAILIIWCDGAVRTYVRGHMTVGFAGAFDPLSRDTLSLYSTLHLLDMPFSLLSLFLLGLFHCVRRWRNYAVFAILYLSLYAMYYSAAAGFLFELLRYLSYTTGLILALVLLGWRELETLAEHGQWRGVWVPVAAAVILLDACGMQWHHAPAAALLAWGVIHRLDTLAGKRPWLPLLKNGVLATVLILLSNQTAARTPFLRSGNYGLILALVLLGWHELETLAEYGQWRGAWVPVAAVVILLDACGMQWHHAPAAALLAWGVIHRLDTLAGKRPWLPLLKNGVLAAVLILLSNQTARTALLEQLRSPRVAPDFAGVSTSTDALVSGDVQTEARWVISALEREPTCRFVTRALRDPRPGAALWDYVFFGGGRDASAVPDQGQGLRAAMAHDGASCFRLFLGWDCERTDSDGCATFRHQGYAQMSDATVNAPSFNDPIERGAARRPMHLALYDPLREAVAAQ